jgi:hypothetical protein
MRRMKNPCHHLGKHDTRCSCRNYQDPNGGMANDLRNLDWRTTECRRCGHSLASHYNERER